MTKIYYDSDADLGVLDGKTVAVLGYGNQGAAQAGNMRDTGVPGVIVGNRDDEYLPLVGEAGFATYSIIDAAAAADVALLLIPDEVQPAVFAEQIAPGMTAGDTLVVASGYNVAFGLLDVPAGVDIVMVAPRMIGAAVRSRYVERVGFPCFVSVERDATGNALATALAVARAIGGTEAGAIASSAREEAALDLLAEQAIWPAILSVFRSAYQVLRETGFSDEAILTELYLSGEPAEIFAAVARDGLLGQMRLHSHTSQYGQLRALAALDTTEQAKRFAAVLHEDILSGRFAQEWSAVSTDPEARLAELRAKAEQHPLAQAEHRLLSRVPNREVR